MGMSGSRHELYFSIEELSAASTGGAVVGVVRDQESVTEIIEEDLTDVVTISTIEVLESVELSGSSAEPARTIQAGELIQVRQLGDARFDSLPAPLLVVDQTYLLFLTQSELPGDASSQFYVTGGTAGIYRATDSGAADAKTYEQVVSEEDSDVLPALISLEDLGGSAER